MISRFDLAYCAAIPALVPYLAWRRFVRGKYTESAAGMMGCRLPDAPPPGGSLWLHAVSVGEVAAARAVGPGLRALLPELGLVVSTVTETGQAAARRAFPDARTTYFPLDFSPLVRRFQSAFDPRVFVLMETELWPNFLAEAHRRGTRCFMLNAKLSDRSFPRYRRLRGVLAPAFGALDGICTQTDVDAERFATLGIPEARIQVVGNCKFDLPTEPLTADERAALARDFGMGDGRWIVAGSTHPGEETLLLDALAEVRRTHATARLLLCPRHPERFDEVARLVRERGWTGARASEGGHPAADVIVLDRMGVLARAYGLGEIVVGGGSFTPIGGHNLLEAAAHGLPVVFGPHMHAQREIMRLMREQNAGVQTAPEALAGELTRLLGDAPARAEQARRGLRVVESNRGSAARGVAAIARWLGRSQPSDRRAGA